MDRNRNSAQPMKNCSMHPMDPIYLFFLLRRVGVVECFNWFFFFFGFHQVFNGFFKMFPQFSRCSSTCSQQHLTLSHICFAQILSSCRLLNLSHMLCPNLVFLQIVEYRDLHGSIFGENTSILRSLQGFRTFCDGPIKEAPC